MDPAIACHRARYCALYKHNCTGLDQKHVKDQLLEHKDSRSPAVEHSPYLSFPDTWFRLRRELKADRANLNSCDRYCRSSSRTLLWLRGCFRLWGPEACRNDNSEEWKHSYGDGRISSKSSF